MYYPCEICEKEFKCIDALKRHVRLQHTVTLNVIYVILKSVWWIN